MENLNWKIIGSAGAVIGSLLLVIGNYIFNSLDNQKTQLLHIHTELNNYIRHFHDNCEDNNEKVIEEIKNLQLLLSCKK